MARRRKKSAAFSLFAFQDIITSVTGIMILVTLVLALELIQRKMSTPAQRTVAVTSQIENAVAINRQAIEQLEAQQKRGAAEMADLFRFDPEDLKRKIADEEQRDEQLQNDLAKLKQQQAKTVQQEKNIESVMKKHASASPTVDQLQKQLQETKEKLKNIRNSNRVVFNPVKGTTKTPWIVEITGRGFSAAPAGRSERPQTFNNEGAFLAWANSRNPSSEYFVLLIKPDGIKRFQSSLQQLKGKRFEVGFDLLTADQTAIDAKTGAGAP